MPAVLNREHENTYRLSISGVLSKADLDRSQDVLLAAMEHAALGKIRLLVVLGDFQGWDARSNWSDLSFYVRHGDRIERIAIVGDGRWRDHVLMFAAADLRRAPVKFFDTTSLDDARKWLAQ
jgi:stage II sporulation SpoAA-like protein